MVENIEQHSFKLVLLGNAIIIGIYLIIDRISTSDYDFWIYCNSYNISLAGTALSQIFPFVFLSFFAQSSLKLKSQNASFNDDTIELQTAFELETSFFRNLYNRKTIASIFTIIIGMVYVSTLFINRMNLTYMGIIPGIIALLLNLISFYLIFKPKERLTNDNIKPRFMTGDINLN